MSDHKTTDICAFCLGEKLSPVRIKCGHSFCHECLEMYKSYQNYSWAKRCPICRSSMERIVKTKSLSSNTNTGNLNPTNTTNESHTPGALTVNHSIPFELPTDEPVSDNSSNQRYPFNYSAAVDDSEDDIYFADQLVPFELPTDETVSDNSSNPFNYSAAVDDSVDDIFYADQLVDYESELHTDYFNEHDGSYYISDEDNINAGEITANFSSEIDEIHNVSTSSRNSLMSLRFNDITDQ